MRSFRVQIFALAALLVAVTEIATIAAVLITAREEVSTRARHALRVGSNVFDEFMQSRGRQLRTTVRVLAADFGFKEAVATRDDETIRSVLANHGRRAEADLALLFDLDGRLLASTQRSQPGTMQADLKKMSALTEDRGALAMLTLDGVPYQMVTVALEAPLPIAWVSMGFVINDELARKLERLTGLQVSFLTPEAGGIALHGSTLSALQRRALLGALQRTSLPLDSTGSLTTEEGEYLALRRSFTVGSEEGVVLQQSLHEAMAGFRDLRLAVLLLGAAALALALLGTMVLSRHVTRPVAQLVAAARRIGVGDYSRGVRVERRDELGELAHSFNAMQHGIAEREQRIIHHAYHDPVTGLANRLQVLEALQSRLQAPQVASQTVSVMVLDLGRFQDVTSSLGHEIGDEVLRRTAQRLAGTLPEGCLLGRLEAAEFVVVATVGDTEAVIAASEEIVRVMDAGLSLHEVRIALDVSVGIALWPQHGHDAETLLRRASIARHDASTERERIHVYRDGREERRRHQLALVGDLRRAAQLNELRIFLQPKIALSSRRPCSAEALVRWDHPELGLITPDAFIPIAEQYGNVVLVTRWVLQRALGQVRRWCDEGLELSVAVNISAQDLHDMEFPAFVRESLHRTGVEGRQLVLEITENDVMRDVARAVEVLQRLRDLGVRLSIDDFGTGHSSLAQIKRLPVDELKIDRSFVMALPGDEADVAIVRSTIELAHSFGLRVVAEGVESVEALEWLAAAGCDQVQGYCISRPIGEAEFLVWAQEHSTPMPALAWHSERAAS